MKTFWNLNDLKQALKKSSEISYWKIETDTIHRYETYLMKDFKTNEVFSDQKREVIEKKIRVWILIFLNENQCGEFSSDWSLYKDLNSQLENAIEIAKNAKKKKWIPEFNLQKSTNPPYSCDPDIKSNLTLNASAIENEIVKKINEKNRENFNSCELFVSYHQKKFIFSNDKSFTHDQSRIYFDLAYSSQNNNKSDEFNLRRWFVHKDQIDLNSLFDHTIHCAQAIVKATLPKAHSYPVLFDEEVLCTLFHDLITHLQSSQKYDQLPFKEKGEFLIPEAKGDLIDLSIDPHDPFGADTIGFSQQGYPQKPQIFVVKNQIKSNITAEPYSQYLDHTLTTTRGTLTVSPGKKSKAELLKQSTSVLEIFQLSGLFTDAATGTFSSEIRLGCIHHPDGSKQWIKGGSISGSLSENLTRAEFSSETARFSEFTSEKHTDGGPSPLSYNGPRYILFNEVPVASSL
ncbi:MAG: hypothetical protein CL678_11290 [Bdellovibrionaceae bacterium]|nr:hypothetical protein [Pseudobdellovibrionaceae bacterium]|tara:strand:+ start:1897 stop:3273 length:1377 start_codon:yes stop_codon:yes gene_type:complete